MAGSSTAHLHDPGEVALRIEDLTVEYTHRSGQKVHAVSNVSLDIRRGETLGLVGESGCGKSSIARAVMQLPPPTSGSVTLNGRDLTSMAPKELRQARSKLQMIFQDPISSLNPRRTVGKIVSQGLRIQRRASEVPTKVAQMLSAVGLDPETVTGRRPREFSGGQCQRICMARVLVLEPEVVICDEPVSSLDVSVQGQILNLLEDMKAKFGLTLLFIAHDLAVVKNISDRVAVMYLGRICEVAPSDDLYERPLHPYTAGLLASIPDPDPRADVNVDPHAGELRGEVPSPLDPPSGCRFRTRCPRAQERCAAEEPVVRKIRPRHFVACHFPLEDVGDEHPQQGQVGEFDPARRPSISAPSKGGIK